MTFWDNKFGYDIESYPNVFTCGITNIATGARFFFEASERRNQTRELGVMLYRLRDAKCEMVGFNNVGYDYPVLHHMMQVIDQHGSATAADMYAKTEAIIGSKRNDWSHSVYESDHLVKQIDLYKIMHFDNFARSTSLKKLEINMRSGDVRELPFKPGFPLTLDQIDPLTDYMAWDIDQTIKFAKKIQPRIEFRKELTEKYGRDVTNYNDTKIGKQHFIDQLNDAGVPTYDRSSGTRLPIQTLHPHGIRVAEKLIPIPFKTPELQSMWQYFHDAVIPEDETKGFFTKLHATLHGFQIDFGAGGIHASVKNKTFRRSETHQILDIDVVSYYPSLAIVNGFYPKHLGPEFVEIYRKLKEQRVSYPKGSPENAMLKLALNGVYGDSNNKYSPMLDPAYTMAITINGQMMLAWLAEMLMLDVPELEMIQMNTDGLTCHIPHGVRWAVDTICDEWSAATLLDLEHVEYERMHIRDVNNYVATDVDGYTKRKNAYLTEPDWHQDHSSLVVPKAVDAYLTHGTRVEDFIFEHGDAFDFMRHVKVPRSSRLMWGNERVQNVSRYHISLGGDSLTKVMPPLAANPDKERHIGIDVGWTVQMCNNAADFSWEKLNRRWYVTEAKTLIKGLGL